jgi:trk system potassium uptake protein TrkH
MDVFIRFQTTLFVIGLMLLALGGIMVFPAAVDFSLGYSDWQASAVSAGITILAGGLMALCYRGDELKLGVSEGFIFTTATWILVTAFGTLPFLLSRDALSFTDAFFESMAGFTTTGATVMADPQIYSPGILIWRSLTQWIGGIGIVVTAIALFPFLHVGGMQLFRTESSDRSERAFTHVASVGRWIVITYVGMTILCTVALHVAGMGWFDSLNHAMTTVATGGFSTRAASIAYYASPAIEWVIAFFMLAGSLPLVFYVQLLRERRPNFTADEQVFAFLRFVGFCVVVMTAWLYLTLEIPLIPAFRQAAFSTVSFLTGTGFVTADFTTWGSFALGAFLIFTFVGGCAGSTVGGIKTFRWILLFASVKRQFRKMRRPHEVFVLRYNGARVSDEAMNSVVNFFFLYMLTLATLSLMMMATGHDFMTSLSGVAVSMTNVGTGLGEVIGPTGNFSSLDPEGKWILCLAMLLGRLELFTVLVLLTPSYWRT